MSIAEPVSSMFSLYLERSDLRPASVEFKQRACRLFIGWFGDLPVGRVKSATAESYRAMLMKTRGQVSVQGYLNNFRPFWRWLHTNGYIEADPFAAVQVRVDEVRRRDTFSAAELGLLMRVADALQRMQICLGLLGCRRGEMLNIQVRDVYLNHERPHVELTTKHRSEKTWPWGTKGHRTRLVAIPADMRFDGLTVALASELHNRLMTLRREPEAYVCVPERYAQKLLDWQKRRPLKWGEIQDPTGNFARRFRALQRRAGIRTLRRFHELRAAFTTSLFDANVPAARIMKIVGHTRIEQSLKYDRKSDFAMMSDVAQIAASAYAGTPY